VAITPVFVSPGQSTVLDFINYFLNGLSLGCIYALIAVGYTMVYGIIKLINFAHGEFYMFGAIAAYYTLALVFNATAGGPDVGVFPLVGAMVIAGVATGALAMGVERLVYRPLRNSGRIVALLAALGVSLLMQNAGQQTFGPNERTFPQTFTAQRYPRFGIDAADVKSGMQAPQDIAVVYQREVPGGMQTHVENIAGRGREVSESDVQRLQKIISAAPSSARVYTYPVITVSNKQIIILLALLLTSLILHVVVNHTRLGRAMRAVSHDFDAAAIMGINVNRVVGWTFFIGATVAGVGGTLAGGMYYNQVGPLMGLVPGLKAFVAAVIGGIGSIPGALLGGLLLGISEKLIEAYFSSLYSHAFTFSLLILMLLVRPSGLLGRPSSDKM
jgi:branched-chain amino acid transport system permease protein